MKKCPVCFEYVPDDASTCPFCRSPLSANPQNNITEEPSTLKYASRPQDTVRAPYATGTPYTAPSQPVPPKKNNSILYFIIGVLATALLFLAGLMIYNYTKDEPKTDDAQSKPTATASPAAEEATPAAAEETYDRSEAQPVVAPRPREVTTEGYHHLSGSISKYGITMDIEVSGDHVQGTYYYHSKGRSNKMSVYGNLYGNDMTLEEYAPDGNNTGCFEGTFDGYCFQGSFVNYSIGNVLRFSVVEQ